MGYILKTIFHMKLHQINMICQHMKLTDEYDCNIKNFEELDMYLAMQFDKSLLIQVRVSDIGSCGPDEIRRNYVKTNVLQIA